jgi:hypothetical protein
LGARRDLGNLAFPGARAFRLDRRDATSFVVGASPWDKSHG